MEKTFGYYLTQTFISLQFPNCIKRLIINDYLGKKNFSDQNEKYASDDAKSILKNVPEIYVPISNFDQNFLYRSRATFILVCAVLNSVCTTSITEL